MSDALWPHGLQHARFPCSSLSPGVCSSSFPLSQWCHSTISSSVTHFSCPQSKRPSIRVFSSELALHIRWSKYWRFSFSISPSNEYSGLISFRMDWFDLLAIQGTLESIPTPQLKNINSLALSPSLWSNSHICTWLLETFQVYLSSHGWEPWGVTDKSYELLTVRGIMRSNWHFRMSNLAEKWKSGSCGIKTEGGKQSDQLGDCSHSQPRGSRALKSWTKGLGVERGSWEMLHLIRLHEPNFIGEKMRLQVVTPLQQVQSR